MNDHSEKQLKALSNKVKVIECPCVFALAYCKAREYKADVARTINISRRMVYEWVANDLKGVVSGL